MTLEKTIKFYEKNLETNRLREAKEYYNFCREVRPDLFIGKKRSEIDKFYLNILIQEYLEQGGIKNESRHIRSSK